MGDVSSAFVSQALVLRSGLIRRRHRSTGSSTILNLALDILLRILAELLYHSCCCVALTCKLLAAITISFKLCIIPDMSNSTSNANLNVIYMLWWLWDLSMQSSRYVAASRMEIILACSYCPLMYLRHIKSRRGFAAGPDNKSFMKTSRTAIVLKYFENVPSRLTCKQRRQDQLRCPRRTPRPHQCLSPS
jgi:hypothetical protein